MTAEQLLSKLQELRTICAVVRCGSTAKASQCLHVAQSSVTRSIQSLERTLQCTLFDRSSSGTKATGQARQLASRVNRSFNYMGSANVSAANGFALDELSWMSNRLAFGVRARHIHVLMMLSKVNSVSHCAQVLGVSPSAVHQTLAQLEHLAGATLFARQLKSLHMTDASAALLNALHLALAELGHAADELSSAMGMGDGNLRIGTLPFSTDQLISSAISRLLERYPRANITLVDGTYDVLLEQLKTAQLDVVVGALRHTLKNESLVQQNLFTDSLAVVCRKGHPLNTLKKLSAKQLASAQWVMPMHHTPAQLAFEQALSSLGLTVPTHAIRVNSALQMLALLDKTDRLAMMSPQQLSHDIRSARLTVLNVDAPHKSRSIGMIYRRDHFPTPLTECFFQQLAAVGEAIDFKKIKPNA